MEAETKVPQIGMLFNLWSVMRNQCMPLKLSLGAKSVSTPMDSPGWGMIYLLNNFFGALGITSTDKRITGCKW